MKKSSGEPETKQTKECLGQSEPEGKGAQEGGEAGGVQWPCTLMAGQVQGQEDHGRKCGKNKLKLHSHLKFPVSKKLKDKPHIWGTRLPLG